MLSVDSLTKDVTALVVKGIEGVLKRKSLLRECAASAEGCSPKFAAEVVDEVKQMVLLDISQSSEELAGQVVKKRVWEALAGYDGDGKKSEVM